jgi:HK97 gp10 family phage protein
MSAQDEIAALRRQVAALPTAVTARLRAVAWRTSRELKDRARATLLSKTHGHGKDHQRTADSFVIIEEPEKKQFLVAVENPENPNLAMWLERGTSRMTARPYLRPAADELDSTYKREMAAAAEDVVTQMLGGA